MLKFIIIISVSFTLFLFSIIYSNKNSIFEEIGENVKKSITEENTTIAIISKGEDAKHFLNILSNSIKSENIKVITRNEEDIKIAENEITFSREFSEEEKEISIKFSSAKYLLIFSFEDSEIKIKIQESSTLNIIKLDKFQYHIRNLPKNLEDVLLYLSILIFIIGLFLFFKEKNDLKKKDNKFEVLIKSAKELLSKQLYNEAELRIADAEQIYPDKKDLHMLKNEWQILKDKFDLKIKEDKFEVLIKSSNELLDKYLYNEVESRLIEASKLFPDNRELHLVVNKHKGLVQLEKIYNKAESNYNEHKYEEALQYVLEVEHIQLDFKNLQILKEKIIQSKKKYDDLYESAYDYLNENKPEIAKDRIDKFLNKNPHHTNARKLKNEIKVKIEKNKVDEFNQKCNDLYNSSHDLYKSHNLESANEKIEELLILDTNNTKAYELKSKIQDKQKENLFFDNIDNLINNNEFDMANELLDEFLSKNKAHNKAIKFRNKLKTIHIQQITNSIKKCFSNNEYLNIEDLFKEAKTIKEDEEINLLEKKYYTQKFISDQLIECDKLVKQKKFSKARSNLKAILKENPDSTGANLFLKEIENSITRADELYNNSKELFKNGKLNQAIEKLRLSIQENPENDDVLELFETLKSQTDYEDKIVFVLKEGSTIKKEIYLFANNVAEIGRNEEVDVHIDSKYLSGIHCHFMYKGGEFIIEDLRSSNSTKVNGNRISSFLLNDRDTVQLAKRVDFNFRGFGEKEKSEDATLIDDENTCIQKIISGKLEMVTDMLPQKDIIIISGTTDLSFILNLKSTNKIFHSDGKFWVQDDKNINIVSKDDRFDNYYIQNINGR